MPRLTVYTEKVPLPVLRMTYGSAADDKLGGLGSISIPTLGLSRMCSGIISEDSADGRRLFPRRRRVFRYVLL